ncbi:MAG: hypothetical protein RML56_09035 [Burkholderiales bacterium]|nr:hypothetical protein [Burkholderiales bacterium]
MFADRYGLPVSTRSREALDAYVAGADAILSAGADWRLALTRALDADPEFALARIALARGLFLDGEAAAARAQAARARAAARGASERERSHVHALALSFEAERDAALEAARAHLARFPRDAMVLAPATGVFGLIGFSGRPEREEELYALLASLSPHYGEDWWFDAAYAFAACETGRLAEAARRIERSLAAHPRNAHGAHVRVHVLYESGEAATIREYLAAWMPGYDRRGLLHCHLSWHAALAALAEGDRDGAWAAYRAAVHPGAAWGPAINVATDAASFLWRAELAGEPRPAALWRDVRDHALRCFPAAGLVFADLHAALRLRGRPVRRRGPARAPARRVARAARRRAARRRAGGAGAPRGARRLRPRRLERRDRDPRAGACRDGPHRRKPRAARSRRADARCRLPEGGPRRARALARRAACRPARAARCAAAPVRVNVQRRSSPPCGPEVVETLGAQRRDQRLQALHPVRADAERARCGDVLV